VAYDDGDDLMPEFTGANYGEKLPTFKQEAFRKNFILTLRKLMLTDKYLKAGPQYQKAFK